MHSAASLFRIWPCTCAFAHQMFSVGSRMHTSVEPPRSAVLLGRAASPGYPIGSSHLARTSCWPEFVRESIRVISGTDCRVRLASAACSEKWMKTRPLPRPAGQIVRKRDLCHACVPDCPRNRPLPRFRGPIDCKTDLCRTAVAEVVIAINFPRLRLGWMEKQPLLRLSGRH